MNLNLDYKTIQDEEKINRLRNEYINTKFSADSELKKQEKMQGYLLWFFIILGALIGWWLVVLLLVYVFNGEFDRFTIICALFIGLPIGAGPINWAFQRFPPVAIRRTRPCRIRNPADSRTESGRSTWIPRR